MKTKMLVSILVGIIALYLGQRVLTGIPSLLVTLVGFLAAMYGCALSIRRTMDKNNR